MKLSPRDRRAILIGVVVVAVIFIGKFALVPWISSWHQAREDIASSRKRLTDIERRIRIELIALGISSQDGPVSRQGQPQRFT